MRFDCERKTDGLIVLQQNTDRSVKDQVGVSLLLSALMLIIVYVLRCLFNWEINRKWHGRTVSEYIDTSERWYINI